MKRVFILGLMLSLFFSNTVLADRRPIRSEDWDSETKLWLARSCVGESGFGSLDECGAIAWVYSAIAKEGKANYLKVVRSYSSAVKDHERHRRAWIFELSLDGKRPKSFPKRLSWKAHKVLWMKMLTFLDSWAKGNVPNPVPGANHYGGSMDTPGAYWQRIMPKSEFVFRNRFYRAGRNLQVAKR